MFLALCHTKLISDHHLSSLLIEYYFRSAVVLLKSTTLQDQSASGASKQKNQSDNHKQSQGAAYNTYPVSEKEVSSRDPNQKLKIKSLNSEVNSLTAQPSDSAHKDKQSPVSAVSSVPQHISHPNQELVQESQNQPKDKRFKKHEPSGHSSNVPTVHNNQSNGQTHNSWAKKPTDQSGPIPTPVNVSAAKETISGQLDGDSASAVNTNPANMPKAKDSKDTFDCKLNACYLSHTLHACNYQLEIYSKLVNIP